MAFYAEILIGQAHINHLRNIAESFIFLLLNSPVYWAFIYEIFELAQINRFLI